MAGKSISWLSSLEELNDYAIAWQGVCRLKHARFLKIGETEPWVINSYRSPERIKDQAGCQVIPIEREELYDIYRTISDRDADKETQQWTDRNAGLLGVRKDDISKACRVTMAMQQIPAASAVHTMAGSAGTPAALRIAGLAARMYAIVRNVASPPRSSFETELPRASIWK